MQGRMLPMVGKKIQAFPSKNWQEEFYLAKNSNFSVMEWTLDYKGALKNPFLDVDGQKKIRQLGRKYSLRIPSVTCDFFMQKPFFKEKSKDKIRLIGLLEKVIDASINLGAEILVIPLVDNSSIKNVTDEKVVIDTFTRIIQNKNIKIAFESDYPPIKLKRFINLFDHNKFGINYDIGNSAALGFNPVVEFSCYGSRIINVHVKDRLYRGTTVPLGCGNADIKQCFKELASIKYNGNYIFQTARSVGNSHSQILDAYREIIYHHIVNNLS